MHEIHQVEKELLAEATSISKKHGGAPVVIIVGGSKEANVPRCMISSTMHQGYRLRDLLGILETAIQIETLKHFRHFPRS
jgi:hypothetical protein